MRVSSPDRRSRPAGQRWRLQMWDMSCDRATQPTRQVDTQTGREQSSLTWRGGVTAEGPGSQGGEWKLPWSPHSWRRSDLTSLKSRVLRWETCVYQRWPDVVKCATCSVLTSINHHQTDSGTLIRNIEKIVSLHTELKDKSWLLSGPKLL